MAQRPGYVLRFATPVRVWVQRFAFFLLVGSAIGLIVIGKADTVLVERARTAVADAFQPILDVMSQPAGSVADAIEKVEELAALHEENQKLREENERLLQWKTAAQQLQAQNARFRDILNFVPDAPKTLITSRVIADSGGAFVRSVLLSSGAVHGVRRGQAAVNGEGLIGRVAEVGRRSSRILLVTDLNSRIPVRIESTRDRAVLAGDNSSRPRLLYLPPMTRVSPGDRVVTSGDGGVFPPGLPVGIVSLIDSSGVRVQPFVNWNRLEYVRVIEYEPVGIVADVSSHAQKAMSK